MPEYQARNLLVQLHAPNVQIAAKGIRIPDAGVVVHIPDLLADGGGDGDGGGGGGCGCTCSCTCTGSPGDGGGCGCTCTCTCTASSGEIGLDAVSLPAEALDQIRTALKEALIRADLAETQFRKAAGRQMR
jgi:hypothetical protein